MSKGRTIEEASRLARAIAPRLYRQEMTGLENLKHRRQKRGLTQADMADALGCRSVTYQEWEQGRHWPSAYWLPQLAALLHCSIEELYQEAER